MATKSEIYRTASLLVREYGEMAARFETNCNGRAFFPSDLAALRAELPAEVLARLK